MLYVRSSMSTKSGRAPACEIASVVAMKVFGTVITVSPGLIPAAIKANRSASVPLDTPTQCCASQKRREISFKFLNHRTANEARGAESRREDVAQFVFELLMRSDQI